MRPLVVLSHTYVEPENRGKLRALARDGMVTAVVPHHWKERALGRSWRVTGTADDEGVRVVPARWRGRTLATQGFMRLPAALIDGAIVQIEEEPWTPTAFFASRSKRPAAKILFTWENIERRHPPPFSWFRRAVFGAVDGLIAGSGAAADVTRSLGFRGPLAVIPQLGVSLPPNLPARAPADRLRVAFVGRLVPEKGVDVLLRALALVGQPWQLALLGDGPSRPGLQRLTIELGLSNVEFAGARPHGDVAAFWATTDVLVLPSRTTVSWREQLGHVLLEAMAHGVAVVGSSCGAIPDVIGEAGRVFAEGDAEALAAELRALAASPGLSATLGEAGRRRVAAEFTNERIAARTRAFHEEVMDRP